jgi:aspartate/methionine/tyrosine aminotransferase
MPGAVKSCWTSCPTPVSIADVGRLTNDSADFCRRMLAETGVAATPGTDFDPLRGNRYVRFSFAAKTTEIEEAADRLIVWR